MQFVQQIKASNIGKRMANGMIWSFSGTAMAKFLTLIAGILCAHILKKETYGSFGMVRSTINLFVIFGASGLGVTATKYISEYLSGKQKDQIPAIYLAANTFALFMGLLCSILILFFADSLSVFFLKDDSLATTIRIGSILLFFSVLNGVQHGALSGFEDFKSIAQNMLLGGVFETILMVLGAYFYGLNGAILGFGSGFIVIYLANRHSLTKQFKKQNLTFLPIKALSLPNLQMILEYSIPAALSSLLITPVFFLLRTMLVRKSGLGELATFEAADQWKVIILFIPTAISQIVLPILSSLQHKNKTFIKTLQLNIVIITCTSFFISIIIYFASFYIMRLYGKDFTETLPLKILAISTVFSAIANVLEMAIYSLGKVWKCFSINIIWAICTLTTAYICLQNNMGATGIAIGILFAYSASCIIFAIYLWQLVKSEKNIE